MTLLTLLVLSQVVVPVPVPIITFPAPPPLVVIQPGVQVVEDNDDEVFFTEGYYWVRRDGRWFRNREHNGKWVLVESGVPVALGRLPPGQYKRWKRQAKEEWKEEKRERKEEKRHGKGKGKD